MCDLTENWASIKTFLKLLHFGDRDTGFRLIIKQRMLYG